MILSPTQYYNTPTKMEISLSCYVKLREKKMPKIHEILFSFSEVKTRSELLAHKIK